MSYDPSQTLQDFLAQNPTNNEADYNYFKQRDATDALRATSKTVTGESGKAGDMELASYNERAALPKTGDFSTAASYWDANRGVQVYAPGNSYFKLYASGAVEPVAGALPVAGATPNSPGGDNAPNTSLFTQPTQGAPGGGTQATPGFQEQNLGYTPAAGKTIKTTGQTVFNPATGVDVQADPGNVWITYTDGTVEQRPVGGAPGQAVDPGTVGKSAKDLGITSTTGIKDQNGVQLPTVASQQQNANALAASGADAQTVEAAIVKAGEAPTAAMIYKGPTYVDEKTKATRTAASGNAFYQDPTTKQIYERPAVLQSIAQQDTTTTGVQGGQTTNTSVADAALAKHGFAANPEAWQQDPLGSFETTYSTLLTQLGVPTVTTQIQNVLDQQKTIDNKYADDVAKVNSDPYLSEALRSKKTTVLQDKYNTNKAANTALLTLYQNVYDKAVDQAKYVATTALTQYNADRKFNADEINAAADRALHQTQAEATLLNAGYKSIQGGLYDVKSGQWIIQPNATDLVELRAELQSQLSAQQAAQALTLATTPHAATAGTFTFDEFAALPENAGKSTSDLFQEYNQAKSTTQSLADQIAALTKE